MNKTSIEWAKNPDGSQGYTSNPITGCLFHINGLCRGGGFPCYAYRLANGRLRSRYLANSLLPTHDEPDHEAHHADPFYPRFWSSRVEDLLRGEEDKAKGIFLCDMGELFGDWIPTVWQEAIFQVIRWRPWHRFYLLTKQPQNLAKFSPFPENCWVGVTATGLQAFNNAMFHLQQIEAKVKFLSLEPLLKQIPMSSSWLTLLGKPIVNQIIIGAQTKPYKPPERKWVEEIVMAAGRANIPIFLKDNLKPLIGENIIPFWQEMPNTKET